MNQTFRLTFLDKPSSGSYQRLRESRKRLLQVDQCQHGRLFLQPCIDIIRHLFRHRMSPDQSLLLLRVVGDLDEIFNQNRPSWDSLYDGQQPVRQAEAFAARVLLLRVQERLETGVLNAEIVERRRDRGKGRDVWIVEG